MTATIKTKDHLPAYPGLNQKAQDTINERRSGRMICEIGTLGCSIGKEYIYGSADADFVAVSRTLLPQLAALLEAAIRELEKK